MITGVVINSVKLYMISLAKTSWYMYSTFCVKLKQTYRMLQLTE